MKAFFFTLYIAVIISGCFSGNKEEIKTLKAKPDAAPGFFRKLTDTEEKYYAEAIKEYYQTHLLRSGFNGSILVAKNDQIVFEDYHGYSDFRTKDSITPNTPFHLASISKTFTGMMIMKLWEQGRLSLDDTLQKFFPQLPYHGVTIRMLLSHRSGLPNYLYFMDKDWDKKVKATNQDVINFMINNKPPVSAMPNRGFSYCNTNFLLLASIVEKITNQPFPQYMKDSVFTPLGMNSTFVFSIKDTAKYVPTEVGNRIYPMDHLDCTYGDKNVYSTPRDMLQWDKSLYLHTFLNKATLDTAYVPQSHEHPSMHNYGLAWRLFTNNGDSIIYHNGKWHGSNTVFTRLVQDTATIIVLGNKFNRNIYHAKEMASVFTGEEDKNDLAE